MKKKRDAIAGFAIFLFLSVRLSGAEDWPQWRGPNRDGVWNERGLSLPTESPVPVWRVSSGGGYASPLVANGCVYIFDSVLRNPEAFERLRCLEFSTGRVLWSESYSVTYPEYAFDTNNKAGPNATCVLQHGKIYSIGATGESVCRNAAKGDVFWRTNLTRSCGLRDYAAITPSPLIEGDLLVMAPGGEANATVVALDKETGEERWRALKDSWTYSSPIVIDYRGTRQLIIWTSKAVTSLDPSSGKTLWREEIASPGDMVVATPIFAEGYLLAGGLMLKVGPGNTQHTVLWPEAIPVTRRIFSNTSTPLLRDDLVFTGTTAGKLICLERDTGKQLWETNSITAPGNGSSLHLTPTADSVLILTDQGNLIQVRLDRTGCREIRRVHAIDPLVLFGGRKVVWNPPVYAEHSVILRNDAETIRIQLGSE